MIERLIESILSFFLKMWSEGSRGMLSFFPVRVEIEIHGT
jgi:hypothetical protein